MALPCAVFETWPNRGHGSPPPCPSVVLCTGGKGWGMLLHRGRYGSWATCGFCWSGDVPNATPMAICSEQTSVLPLCFGFFHWGQTHPARRVTSAPGCPTVLWRTTVGKCHPPPLSQRAHLSHFLGCNKKHLQALLNWCKSGVTSLVLEGPNTVSDKNEAKCSCLNPSL